MRGGRRPGRRPKPARVLRLAPASPVEDLATPPDGLSKVEAAIWAKLAPAACRRGTLVAATREGFVALVEVLATKRTIKASMQRQRKGVASTSAARLLRQFLQLSARADGGLARFGLTPFGKPVEPDTLESAANPWEQVGGRPRGFERAAVEEQDDGPDAA